MLATINGFSRALVADSIHPTSAMSNPIPTLDFEIEDTGSLIGVNCLDEVVLIDESAYGYPIFNIGHNPARRSDFCGRLG